jgi:hypothetical protein
VPHYTFWRDQGVNASKLSRAIFYWTLLASLSIAISFHLASVIVLLSVALPEVVSAMPLSTRVCSAYGLRGF